MSGLAVRLLASAAARDALQRPAKADLASHFFD